jgi:hypothetical protein
MGQLVSPDKYETFAPRIHHKCDCASSLRIDADAEWEKLALETIGIGNSPLTFLS